MSVRFKRKTTWSTSTSCWTAINCNLLSCSLEIPNSCEWSVSCAARWWSGWEEAGPLWMSSWLRTIPAEVQIHNALHYFLAKKTTTTTFMTLWHFFNIWHIILSFNATLFESSPSNSCRAPQQWKAGPTWRSRRSTCPLEEAPRKVSLLVDPTQAWASTAVPLPPPAPWHAR